MNKKGLGKLAIGTAIGAAAGILLAPKSGKETRKELKGKFDELVDKVKKIDAKEVKEDLEDRISDIKAQLADLDKEDVKEIALEKANALKDKIDDLVEVAKEKGTPAVEKAAEDVRKKAISVIKSIEKKLEKK